MSSADTPRAHLGRFRRVYHLYFKAQLADGLARHSYHKLTFLRPLGPPLLVSNELVSTERETVHLLVPVNEDVSRCLVSPG